VKGGKEAGILPANHAKGTRNMIFGII